MSRLPLAFHEHEAPEPNLEVTVPPLLTAFLKVMEILQKHRLAHVAILLACGIGIGFALRTIPRGNAPVGGGTAEPSSAERISGPAEPRSGEDWAAAVTIEEQLAAAVKHGNEQDQRQAARAVFADLGLDELTPLVARVEKFTEEFSEKEGINGGWILCNEFYRRWGELAPLEALKFLKDHKSYWAGMIESVWSAWARTDPDAAMAAYDPKLESQYSRELQDAVLDGLCSVDPAKALRFADAQERGSDFTPENRDEIRGRYSASWELLEHVPVERPNNTFGLALYSWIYRDPEGALAAMLALQDNSLQRTSLNALFSNWIMCDPDAALLALKKITDRGLREATTHTAMQAYLLRQPREAFAKVIALPKYVAYRYKGKPSQEIDPFAEVDPSVDTELIEMDEEEDYQPLPYRYCDTTPTRISGRMNLISEAAASLGISKGKAAWDTAAAIEDKNKRAAALGGALAGWLIFDLGEAAGFTAAAIADHSFEESGGSDFPDFAARLVSKNLTKHDFQQAVAWVEALPAGPLREAGIETAAKTRFDLAWHLALKEASPNGGVDPQVFQEVQIREDAPVMEWLASLPPSTGRDEATYWLVFRLESNDDPSGALKSAATIEDPRLRRICFESLAGKIFSKKSDTKAVDFDFDAWSAGHPELAAELKLELARKKNDKGGGDEK